LNEKTVEYVVLSQEAYSRKRLYEDLYSKLQEANVSAGIKATNITIVDPARPQTVPVSPKRLPNLEAGIAVGFLLGLLLAFTVDRLDSTVIASSEVEEITGVPVIGMIPLFDARSMNTDASYGTYFSVRKKSAKGSSTEKPDASAESLSPDKLAILECPDSMVAESIRSLRTAILLSRPSGELKSILITSCVPAEGKSTITGNLAVSLAQHGRKVIIVEADMRRPTMRHVMNVVNERGLSSVLSGVNSLQECIQHGVHVATLDILPAGPRPPMPSELLGGIMFDNLLRELSARYDTVLVDSPPALLLTDAVSIASKMDAVVWVARAGTVTRPQLSRAMQVAERNRFPLVGFVLNAVDLTLDPYGYGYGSGYGYRYGYGYGSYLRSGDEEA
jgi:capsular exopolysaccharide synthesis family protein